MTDGEIEATLIAAILAARPHSIFKSGGRLQACPGMGAAHMNKRRARR